MWDKIQALWNEVKTFFDRVVGWLYYVLGGGDDPYVYDTFYDNTYPDNV